MPFVPVVRVPLGGGNLNPVGLSGGLWYPGSYGRSFGTPFGGIYDGAGSSGGEDSSWGQVARGCDGR